MSLSLRWFGFIILLSLFLHPDFCRALAPAHDYCDWDNGVRTAFQKINQLDLDEAEAFLKSHCKPSNAARLLMEDYIDFYRVFIYENRKEYHRGKAKKNERIASLQKSSLDKRWSRFIQAEIHLHWAILHFKMNESLDAFQDAGLAIRLLEANHRQFPEFAYTYKSLGLMHALIGTVPDEYSWAARLIGFEGSLDRGKKELSAFVAFAETHNDIFKEEAYAAFSFFQAFLENKPQQAYHYWTSKVSSIDPTPLNTWVHSRLASRAGYNDAVINIVSALPQAERQKLPVLYFLLGQARLNKLDGKASADFLQFLHLFRGNSYVKEAYLKLSWCCLLNNDLKGFHFYKKECLSKSIAMTDEDKLAQSEAQSDKIPDLELLKARLLFDGGYVRAAYHNLLTREMHYMNNPEYRLEYSYRMGRLCQADKKYEEALRWFQRTIQFDPSCKNHISSNALLQTGLIWEARNKPDTAVYYYRKVLDCRPAHYRRSIHQKAKAGFNRLKD